MMKNYERYLHESQQRKRVYVLYSALQAIALLAVIGLGVFLSYAILTYTERSRTYFEGAHSLVRLNAQFMNSLAISCNDNTSSYMIVIGSFGLRLGLPPPYLDTFTNSHAMAMESFIEAQGQKDVLKFLINRKVSSSERWKIEFVNFANAIDRCSSEPDVLKTLLNVRPAIYDFESTNNPIFQSPPISLVTFLRNFEFRNNVLLSSLIPMREMALGKEPPYEFFPLDFINSFIEGVLMSTEAIQSSFNGVLSLISNSISELKEVIVVTQADSFNTSFTIMSCSLFFLMICGVVGMMFVLKDRVTKMNIVLEAYKFLRNDDIQKIGESINLSARLIKDSRFNEVDLLDRFLNLRYIIKGGQGATTPHSHSNKKYGESQSATFKFKKVSTKKHTTIVQDNVFSFSFCAILTNALLVVTMSIFFSLAWIVKNSGSKIHEIERIYFDACIELSRVSESITTHYIYLTYGNFIKIDGKYIEDEQPQAEAIEQFVSFFFTNRERISAVYPESSTDDLGIILFGNMCNFLNDPDPYQQLLFRYMCLKYLPATQGFISYLSAVKDQIADDRSEMKRLAEYHLNITRTQVNELADKRLYLNANSVRIRELMPKLTEVLVNKLFEATDSALSYRFDLVLNSLTAINQVVTYGLGIIFAVLIVATYRLMQANSDVCRETFANMLPEVVFSNPHLSHTFDHHVSASK